VILHSLPAVIRTPPVRWRSPYQILKCCSDQGRESVLASIGVNCSSRVDLLWQPTQTVLVFDVITSTSINVRDWHLGEHHWPAGTFLTGEVQGKVFRTPLGTCFSSCWQGRSGTASAEVSPR